MSGWPCAVRASQGVCNCVAALAGPSAWDVTTQHWGIRPIDTSSADEAMGKGA